MNNSLNTFSSLFPKSTCPFLDDTVQNGYSFDCCSLFVLSIISRTVSYIIKKNFKNTLLKVFHHVCMCAQSSVTSDSLQPQGLRPTGCSGREIFQARVLEWVAMFYSRGSS